MKKHLFLCSLACATSLSLSSAAIDYVAADAQLLILTYNSPSSYLNANSTEGNITVYASPKGLNALWTLQPTETADVYYLYNEATNLYVGKTSTESTSVKLAMVSDIDNAGRYLVAKAGASDQSVSFRDIDNNGDAPYLNASNTEGGNVLNFMLMNGTNWRPNSMFYLSDDLSSISSTLIDQVNAQMSYTYVGDYNPTLMEPLISAVEADTTDADALKALWQASLSGEYLNKPIEGHFYQITSTFPYFKGYYLKETYYTIDYHPTQNRQRVHFHPEDLEENEVPTYWLFDLQSTVDDVDYYLIRAVNSGKVWRKTSNNTIVDLRDDTETERGLYTIVKDDYVVYDHAVALKCYFYDYSANPYPYLGTYTINQGEPEQPYSHDGEETDIRDGCSILTPTDDFVQGANNWHITEVTEVPVYFYHPDDLVEAISLDESSQEYYTTVYYPFAVKIPAELTAYSAGINLVNGGDKLWLTQLETSDGYTNIIPAYSPVILKAPGAGKYLLEILYDDTHASINFGLEGAITPVPLDSGQQVYVINDDCDELGNLVTEGEDYSFDYELEYKDSGKAAHQLYTSDSTYIIAANTAYVLPGELTKSTIEIDDLQLPTTGVEDVTIDRIAPGEDTDADVIYYDLTGRRVSNPRPGLYILSMGQKVLIK